MRKMAIWTFTFLSMVSLAAARPAARNFGESHGEGRRGNAIMTFHTMYGVDGPFVGEGFLIRGIPGDELPWVIKEAHGRLDKDGRLMIHVRGLVFKDDPSVPPELRGKNDESDFRGVVSCWTEAGDQVKTVNVFTEGFSATPSGDSLIRTAVKLPNPCVGPIIMVLAGSEDKWFAVAGFEAEEEEEEGVR